ncbi:hypothetical protein CU097_007967 [Rhizopus azygosporus]|uniref:Uncharacterized protein n=1 Tax=Rhizopus azygosporus TaxID=86630 RepID=A0A367K0Y9_RHIAZ|nr:hypothetical protein CU097_007967 [Rhizopus azygosporus]
MYTSPRGAKKPNYYVQTASLISSETTARVESNAAKALQAMQRIILHTPQARTGATLTIIRKAIFKSKVAVFTTRDPADNIREREKSELKNIFKQIDKEKKKSSDIGAIL